MQPFLLSTPINDKLDAGRASRARKAKMEEARDRLFKEGRVTKLQPTEEALAAAPDDYQRLRLGCWLWTGCSIKKGGHGHIRCNKKLVLTHRLSYCLHNNKSFDDIVGLEIRHDCDMPNCINPEHLREGTHSDNMRDRNVRGRAAKKLTKEKVDAIRADTRKQVIIADEYGVSISLISQIKSGKSWAT